jgi:hypothetical protein
MYLGLFMLHMIYQASDSTENTDHDLRGVAVNSVSKLSGPFARAIIYRGCYELESTSENFPSLPQICHEPH